MNGPTGSGPVAAPSWVISSTARRNGAGQSALREVSNVTRRAGVQGLATLYDVSEAIVGEVPTLDEPDDLSVVRCADGTWLLGGSLAIEEFKEIFGIRSLPGEGRHYRTLAGFLMMQLGRVPTEGEHFEWGTLHFEVVDMDRHRIDKIIAKPRQ